MAANYTDFERTLLRASVLVPLLVASSAVSAMAVPCLLFMISNAVFIDRSHLCPVPFEEH
jgi:hypothetical protein